MISWRQPERLNRQENLSTSQSQQKAAPLHVQYATPVASRTERQPRTSYWINIDEADQSEPVLKMGSTGLPVRPAQKRMSLVGYDVGGVNGRYGTATKGAVKKLQQQRGLAVDGVVGLQTWSIIDSLENEGPVS